MNKQVFILAVFLVFSINLYSSIQAYYYNNTNDVTKDISLWSGKISKKIDTNKLYGIFRPLTCRYDRAGREDCYTYTYNTDPNDFSKYADRFIYFRYKNDLGNGFDANLECIQNPKQCVGTCMRSDNLSQERCKLLYIPSSSNRIFQNPLPVLAERGIQKLNNAWSAAWEGSLKIPENGTWSFALSLIGTGYIEVCDTKGKCQVKHYPYHVAIGTYSDQNDDNIKFSNLKQGDSLNFKVRYSSFRGLVSPLIMFQWHRQEGMKDIWKLKPALGHSNAISEIGDMGVIPNDFMSFPNKRYEFKVVEKTFADQGNKKGFDWVWNSPLRTKVAGSNSEYCLLAGVDGGDGKFYPYTSNVSANVALNYDTIVEVANKFTLQSARFPILNSNNTLKTITYNQNSPYSACFSISNEAFISKKAHFVAFLTDESNKINDPSIEPNRTSSNNAFAIRPAGYKIDFRSRCENGRYTNGCENTGVKHEVLSPSDLSLEAIETSNVKLFAGLDYNPEIYAQALDTSDSKNIKFKNITEYKTNFGSYTLKQGKYTTGIEDTILKPIINTDMDCKDTDKANLGQALFDKKGEYGLNFRENKVEFKKSDFVNLSSDGTTVFETKLVIPRKYDSSTNAYNYYLNVMKFQTKIIDKSWTLINSYNVTDYDKLDIDTKNKTKKQIETYGYQCKGYSNKNLNPNKEFEGSLVDCDVSSVYPKYIEMIPYKFVFDFKEIKNAGEGFTYIHDIGATNLDPAKPNDKHNMTAGVSMLSIPVGVLNNARLSNFSDKCYGTDVNMTIRHVGDMYTKNSTTIPAELITSVNNYMVTKAKFNTDVNASGRITFDETYYRGLGVDASVLFNQNHKDFNTAKYNKSSLTYSDYNQTNSTNMAHYTIGKGFFKKDNDGAAAFRVAFNFTRDHTQADDPFIISTLDFDVYNFSYYKSDKIKAGIIHPNYPINTDTTKPDITQFGSEIGLMLFGRVYAPFYTGPAKGFNEKIYYGFYNSNGCNYNQLPKGLSGDSFPQTINYCINLKHNDPRLGYWSGYNKFNNTNMTRVDSIMYEGNQAPKFIKQTNTSGEVINLYEVVNFKNENAVRDEIRLLMPKSPWLRYNSSKQAEYNEFQVLFTGEFNDWGGKAYDSKGEETGVGKFMFKNNEVPPRTNRRIEW